MSEVNISIPGGGSKRLLTGGKYCPGNIVVTAQTPEPIVEKDVNFYDYDGTLLYSYTLEEAQGLTELPQGPTHDGLVFDGWNWSLEGVNALTRPMTIGAMFCTDDGATRLYFEFPDTGAITQPLYFSQTVTNGVTIDWGDGSTETIAGTGTVNTSHTFLEGGNYMVRLLPNSECTLTLGANQMTAGLFGEMSSPENHHIANNLVRAEIGRGIMGAAAFRRCGCLKTVTLPRGMTIANRAFLACANLQCVVVPLGVTGTTEYMLSECTSLRIIAFPSTLVGFGASAEIMNCKSIKRVDIPDGIDQIIDTAFRFCDSLVVLNKSDDTKLGAVNVCATCYRLREIHVGNGLTTLATNAFYQCHNLRKATITNSVTNIGAGAFSECYGLKRLIFKPETPPIVANSNAFTGIPTDCVVEVPADSLSEYQTATNYASLAAQMVGVSL